MTRWSGLLFLCAALCWLSLPYSVAGQRCFSYTAARELSVYSQPSINSSTSGTIAAGTEIQSAMEKPREECPWWAVPPQCYKWIEGWVKVTDPAAQSSVGGWFNADVLSGPNQCSTASADNEVPSPSPGNSVPPGYGLPGTGERIKGPPCKSLGEACTRDDECCQPGDLSKYPARICARSIQTQPQAGGSPATVSGDSTTASSTVPSGGFKGSTCIEKDGPEDPGRYLDGGSLEDLGNFAKLRPGLKMPKLPDLGLGTP